MSPVWTSEACSNPMFLSLTLKQLISNGSWATLRTYRDKLLSVSSVPELMEIIITDIKDTVYVSTVHRPDIIHSIFQLIYCSREGLYANEIVDIVRMHQKNHPDLREMPVMDKQACFPILTGLKHLLTCRRGIYNFSHDFVRQAVESLFFCNGTTFADLIASGDTERLRIAREEELNVHRLLCAYFSMSAGIDNSTLTWQGAYPRPMRELTYHQRKAGVRPSVVVAARLRPFNERERALYDGSTTKVCRMKGKQIMLTDPVTQKPLVFGLDFAFDSSADAPDSREYASQERVYKLCGSDIVMQTLDGYNSTILAYGQTGSGKSYSMFGVKGQPGLIPLTLQELIRQLNLKSKRDGWRWSACCTMVEIYLDDVRDLLRGDDKTALLSDSSAPPSREIQWSTSNPNWSGMARYLMLSFPPKSVKPMMNFSQIAVYSNGENIAVGKPTTSNHDYKNADSGIAVDGNLITRDWPYVYHSTGCSDDYWEVDFLSEYKVDKIDFYNRQTCCERSIGMIFSLLDCNREVVWSSSLQSASLTDSFIVTKSFGEWLVTAPDFRCGSVSWRGCNHDILLRLRPIPKKCVLNLNSLVDGEWGLSVTVRLPVNLYPLRFRVVANSLGFYIYTALPTDDENFSNLLYFYAHRLPWSSEYDETDTSFGKPSGTSGWQILSAGMPWYPDVDTRLPSSKNVEVYVEDENVSEQVSSTNKARFLTLSFPFREKRFIQISQIAAFCNGENVAKHKPTASGPNYESSQSCTCVDGVLKVRDYPNIYHSKGTPDDYWEVDFTSDYVVDKVEFYNRSSCSERSGGMVITLLDSDRDVIWSTTLKGNETVGTFEIPPIDLANAGLTSENVASAKTVSKSVTLRNATIRHIRNIDDVMNVIREGEAHREVKATDMNDTSSRSHCIMTLTVTQRLANATSMEHTRPLVSKINLVDLAGSEKGSKSGHRTKQLLREAISTNQSLSALNNCIRALIDPSNTHIPYRGSKLTWMLQDSLGGTAKTVLLATLSPCPSNFSETLSTLRYASLARQMPNHLTQDPAAAALFEEAENIRKAEFESRQSLCDKYHFAESHLDLMREFYGSKSEVSFQWFDVGTISWKSEWDRWEQYHTSRQKKSDAGEHLVWVKRIQFSVQGQTYEDKYIITSPGAVIDVNMVYSFFGYNTAICQLQVAVDIFRPIIDVVQICGEKKERCTV